MSWQNLSLRNRVAESESAWVGGFGRSRNLKQLWSLKKMPDSKKNMNFISLFVHFTWAKLILNISLQELQSSVA